MGKKGRENVEYFFKISYWSSSPNLLLFLSAIQYSIVLLSLRKKLIVFYSKREKKIKEYKSKSVSNIVVVDND